MLISGIFKEFISGVFIWICTGLYNVAAWVFKLFLILAQGKLIDSDSYKVLINNTYIIIGVVMLFVIAFALLRGMINPDDSNKGTDSIKKVFINLVTSLVLLAIIPTIFTFAFDFQTSIFTTGTIGKIFGYGGLTENNVEEGNSDYVESGAFKIVNSVFTAFFNVNVDANSCEEIKGLNDLSECQSKVTAGTKYNADDLYDPSVTDITLSDAISSVNSKGNFGIYNYFAEAVDDNQIDFNFLLCLIAGILLVYVGISYSIDMGIRLVKLVFYQAIAPIPIMLRIIPNSKFSEAFNQWIKITISIYIDVFIRIFSIYLCIYLCNAMTSEGSFLETNVYKYGFFLALLAKATVILGIIVFMKQAPKLIGEVTGFDSSNLKLGIRDKLKDGGLFAAGGAIGGFIGGTIAGKSPIAGIRAARKGAKGDLTGIGAEAQNRKAKKDAKAAGATRSQIMMDSVRKKVGLPSLAEAEEQKIKEGATKIKNNSSTDIEYEVIDKKGNARTEIIKHGENAAPAEIDDIAAEALQSKKTKNIGIMSDMNDQIREKDKSIKWAGSMKSWKKDMDEEAQGKFNDGKVEHNIRYADANGNYYTETVNGKRLTELSQQGMKFINSDTSKDAFEVEYEYVDKAGKKQLKKLSGNSLSDIQRNVAADKGTILNTKYIGGDFVTEKKVRDEFNAKFATSELSSGDPNLIKNKTAAFFATLENEGGSTGFAYKNYVYNSDGSLLYENGKPVLDTGNYTSQVDKNSGKRTVTHTYKDRKDGKEKTIVYTETAGGMFEYKDEHGNTQSMSFYDLSDSFDKKSKGTSAVLEAEKQAISESQTFIKARDENEAIDALLKQREEKIAETLQSDRQRQLEASKKYTANRPK